MVYGRANGQAAPPPVAPAQSQRQRWRTWRSVARASRTRARTRRRSCTRSRARARPSDQSAVGSAGRLAETLLCHSRVAGAAPCAAHFHTRADCGVLMWMAGQAKQGGSIASYARFEPARVESASPLSRLKISDFQEAQIRRL